MMIRTMKETDLDRVVVIENICFSDPWSRKSFEDSLEEPAAHLLVMTGEESGGEDDRETVIGYCCFCLLYTSPSPRDRTRSRMPSSA